MPNNRFKRDRRNAGFGLCWRGHPPASCWMLEPTPWSPVSEAPEFGFLAGASVSRNTVVPGQSQRPNRARHARRNIGVGTLLIFHQFGPVVAEGQADQQNNQHLCVSSSNSRFQAMRRMNPRRPPEPWCWAAYIPLLPPPMSSASALFRPRQKRSLRFQPGL